MRIKKAFLILWVSDFSEKNLKIKQVLILNRRLDGNYGVQRANIVNSRVLKMKSVENEKSRLAESGKCRGWEIKREEYSEYRK